MWLEAVQELVNRGGVAGWVLDWGWGRGEGSGGGGTAHNKWQFSVVRVAAKHRASGLQGALEGIVGRGTGGR